MGWYLSSVETCVRSKTVRTRTEFVRCINILLCRGVRWASINSTRGGKIRPDLFQGSHYHEAMTMTEVTKEFDSEGPLSPSFFLSLSLQSHKRKSPELFSSHMCERASSPSAESPNFLSLSLSSRFCARGFGRGKATAKGENKSFGTKMSDS